jgi:hypothetical protein
MNLEFSEDVVEMFVRGEAHDVVGVAVVFLDSDDVEALDLEFFAPLFHHFDAFDFLVGLDQFHYVEFFQGSIEALLKFEAGLVVVHPSVYSELVVFHVLDLKRVLLEFVSEGLQCCVDNFVEREVVNVLFGIHEGDKLEIIEVMINWAL